MTGTSTELLNGFRAHKLLKHGMKPLQWEATSREAAYPEHICKDGLADWGPAKDCLNCGDGT